MDDFMSNIKIEELLSKEQLEHYNRGLKYNNNNINGFGLPITIDKDNQYFGCLEDKLREYLKSVTENIAFNCDADLINEIEYANKEILEAIDDYLCGDIWNAQQRIYSILDKYRTNRFILSELGNSYAFKGIAPIPELQRKGYDYSRILDAELSFFRGRKSGKVISNSKEMEFIPLDKREIVSTARFSIAGVPCLYLGTTSYCCWLELDRPAANELYCSALEFTDAGKKLKVLNLAISEGLINGVFNRPVDSENGVEHELQRAMMKIFPLIIATSFHINQENRKFKSEYIVSQLIMQNLKQLNIDGVAYISKKSYSDYEYPHNVNLAIPVNKKNAKIIESCYQMGKPISLGLFTMIKDFTSAKKSYINTNFEDGFSGEINPGIKLSYSSTIFSSYDDFLCDHVMK